MAVTEKFVGQPVLRKEDPEFLTGTAKYTDDLIAPGMLWMAVVRSPYANARVQSVDLSAALAMDGVVAAYSAKDFEWAGPLLMAWPVTDDLHNPPHHPLADERARYQGEGVAVVVAESRGLAGDAAEAVAVEYEPLSAVTDVEAALTDGAPLVHEELGTNRSYTWTNANGDVDEVFGGAAVVIKERYRVQRQVPNAMEPRAVLVEPNLASGQFTMWTSTQIPHVLRTAMALATGIPESKLRIVAPRVGGGFGSKLQVYPEEALALAIAAKIGRPIKWTESRTEGYLSTHHGRDQVQEIELAADEDGRILGYRIRVLANMGAYLRIISPGTPILGAFLYCGCYGGEAYKIDMIGVFTNTTPVDAYRGAGRPEATQAIERAIDALARRMGKDPVEVRRMNFLPPFTEPTPSIGGLTIDSGNYAATLDAALELFDLDAMRGEQRARRENQDVRQIGIGFSTYLENCGWGPSRVIGGVLKYAGGGWEAATIRCHPTGKVVAVVGTTPHGQGNETTFAQIVADGLGIPVDDVEVLFGDTDVAPSGWDTYGSRSAAVGTPAVHRATQKVIAKARKIAAHELEVTESDIEFEDGKFFVKGAPDVSRTIPAIAFSAWRAHDLPDGVEPGLEESAFFNPENLVFPFGAHICAVEVDTETGATEILKYVAVDDVGPVINPQIVEGQVVGGVIQGIAEALFEEAVYDDQGNLTTSSMTQYLVPAASEMPAILTGNHVTPSTTNELGIKGVGETGTIASPPAVLNAVVDALGPLGVTEIERPASPERVWRAIRAAKGGAA
ncbi:MAG TPA: xanthine dehydrogenase family protein molybdopterin-binding subunit [Actinomycetota bacterium]|nr:xanthine dehydrogenase family protein molybdopterin-binding subunit [Actinomycetota bacterium]